MHIDSYSYGKMTIDGKTYTKDLIIFPQEIRPDWWRNQGHSLAFADLRDIIEYQPDTLIVGRGESGMMQVPRVTKEALADKEIRLIEKDTAQAAVIFNQKIEKGEKVVGAFHLTC